MSDETLEQKVDRLLGILDKGTDKTDELMNRGADAYSKASKFKGFLTSWKGIGMLSVILGITIWITGPIWLPWLVPIMLPLFQSEIWQRLQTDLSRYAASFQIDSYAALIKAGPYLFATFTSIVSALFAVWRTGRLFLSAGSKVKNTVNNVTRSEAEKQLQATVDSLTEEKTSLRAQMQTLEGQTKEAKATITVLEQQLNDVTEVKNSAMDHIDEIYSHAGLKQQLLDLGFKRYTEK